MLEFSSVPGCFPVLGSTALEIQWRQLKKSTIWLTKTSLCELLNFTGSRLPVFLGLLCSKLKCLRKERICTFGLRRDKSFWKTVATVGDLWVICSDCFSIHYLVHNSFQTIKLENLLHSHQAPTVIMLSRLRKNVASIKITSGIPPAAQLKSKVEQHQHATNDNFLCVRLRFSFIKKPIAHQNQAI